MSDRRLQSSPEFAGYARANDRRLSRRGIRIDIVNARFVSMRLKYTGIEAGKIAL